MPLSTGDRGVDHVPGIERGDDPPHFYPVFVPYRSLDDLRAQAAISLDERDAAREALRRRLVHPAAFAAASSTASRTGSLLSSLRRY